MAKRFYTGSLPLHIKIEDDAITKAYVSGHEPSLSLSYASWASPTEATEFQTNRLASSYPTARTIVHLSGSVVGTQWSPVSGTFDIRDDEIFYAIADAITRHVAPMPAGVKRIRVWLNFGGAGVAVASIDVWYADDDVRSFSISETPFSALKVPDLEIDDNFLLERVDSKTASDVTTMANNATQEYKLMKRDIPAAYPAEMSETAVSNLESRLWRNGYIKSITLPTIELRLAQSNDYWAAQKDAEPVMPWHGRIGETNENARAFRYQCEVKDSVGLDNSRGDRLLALRDLDKEVKKHFKTMAGREITTGLGARAQFIAAEIAAFNAAIANANAGVSIIKNLYAEDVPTWIDAEYDFSNGWHEGDRAGFNYVTDQGTNHWTITYSPSSMTAHAYGNWYVNVSATANPAYTNSGIRVDGHQNQMMKTLWKFKNLRDPNL